MKDGERRRDPRMELGLPVRVQGHDPDASPWEEMTQTRDASFGGASFALAHGVSPGQCLLLSLPLPKRFRRFDLSEPSYRVYALVRDVARAGATARVGTMFLGKTAPKGYATQPGSRYLLASDPAPAPKERRHDPRIDIFVNFRIRARSEAPGRREEQTVAENLGKRGARVMTSLSVGKGDMVEVEEVGGPFRTLAEIKNVYIGKDNIPRLNLRFLEEAPERLLRVG